MNIYVFEHQKEADEFVAKCIIEEVNRKKHAVIGFATGSTPQGTYQELIHAYRSGIVDFKNTIAFNLDEYAGMERSHPCSFANAMYSSLFQHINIPASQIYSLNGAAEDLDQECAAYEELIKRHPIDIQLLGIGMDGHIAYNEPGTSFDSTTHVMSLHPESIESSLDYGFTKIEEVPLQGMTQGIKTIMQAKQLIMMAIGSKKAALVKRMLSGKVEEAFPSSIIQQHPNVIVVLDKEAAAQLKEELYEKC